MLLNGRAVRITIWGCIPFNSLVPEDDEVMVLLYGVVAWTRLSHLGATRNGDPNAPRGRRKSLTGVTYRMT